MKNSPSFQYYPADLISDPEVMFWDAESVGAYWLLINYLWLNGGKFELNFNQLRQIFRKKTEKSAQTLWRKIQKKFQLYDNIVTHKRVTEEMQKQSKYRLMKQNAGSKGGKKRKQNYNSATKKTVAKSSSSSSSSSSDIDSVTTKDNINKEGYTNSTDSVNQNDSTTKKKYSNPIAGKIYELWAEKNGVFGFIEVFYNQWLQAYKSHGEKNCLKYIKEISATKPGIIINRMDIDSADGTRNNGRKEATTNQRQSKIKKYDGSDTDWYGIK